MKFKIPNTKTLVIFSLFVVFLLFSTHKLDVVSLDSGDLSSISDLTINEGQTRLSKKSTSLDGTITGATYVTGKQGDYALSFGGSGDHVDLGGDSSLKVTDDWTYSFWVYSDDWSSNSYNHIFSQNTCGGTGGPCVRMASTTKKPQLLVAGSDFGYMDKALTNSKWEMLTIVSDSNGITWYLDSVEQSKSGGATQPTMTYHASESFNLASEKGSSRFLTGLIDDVAIYNKALSQSEISSLYSGSIPVSSLVAYYNMEEGSASTIYSGYESSGSFETNSFSLSDDFVPVLNYCTLSSTQSLVNGDIVYKVNGVERTINEPFEYNQENIFTIQADLSTSSSFTTPTFDNLELSCDDTLSSVGLTSPSKPIASDLSINKDGNFISQILGFLQSFRGIL